MSRPTSRNEPYPYTGREDPQSGSAPVRDPQTARYSISPGSTPAAPQALSNPWDGRSSFATAPSSVSTEGSNTTVPHNREPRVGSELEYMVSSPQRDGNISLSSNPPLRSVSRAEGSIYQTKGSIHSPHIQYSHDPIMQSESNHNNMTGSAPLPPSMSTESSMTPSIRFERLDGVILDSHILELRRMVSNHSLQRQKLATAGSALSNFQNETQSLRASAESLTGRVDRVLSDTIQIIVEGDNIMSSLSKAFDKPLEQAGIPTANLSRTDPLRTGQPIGPHVEDTAEEIPSARVDACNAPQNMRNTPTNSIPRAGSNAPADPSDNTHEDQRSHTPSPQAQAMMDQELPPRTDNETDDQYDGRHRAHLNRINNTQRSWVRNGYDAPPHLPPCGTQPQDNVTGFRGGAVLPGQPGYIPGRM